MRLVRQGVDFDQALRLGRAEGARVRTALGLANPSLISPAAAELLPRILQPGDVVLLKGSRSAGIERLAEVVL